jgi:hypothetical protein
MGSNLLESEGSDNNQLLVSGAVQVLKVLSHEIETGCRWYGCVDLYLERCHWRFLNLLVSPSIFNSN